jgi:threonine dehydratase
MWQGTSDLKAAAARAYGATVDREATDPTGAFARLEELRAESGRAFVHPYDDPAVIEGHSSLSREILEDSPETGVIVTGVGGGGLVSGVAVGAPGARVVGVEPEGSAALHEALAAGHPVPVRPDSIADALNAPVAGEHCLAVCLERGVESVLVSEGDIRGGFRFLYERAKLAAEPGAAAGVGALLAGKVPDVDGKTVAVVVSGGNVAGKTAAAILSSNED